MCNSLIQPIEQEHTDELELDEVFNFSLPESVLIKVYADELGGYGYPTWKGFSIDETTVIKGFPNVCGAASYELSYGGFLDQTVMQMVDCPGEGWFVVEDITADYFQGDMVETDDDMTFYHTRLRPATKEEIGLA